MPEYKIDWINQMTENDARHLSSCLRKAIAAKRDIIHPIERFLKLFAIKMARETYLDSYGKKMRQEEKELWDIIFDIDKKIEL